MSNRKALILSLILLGLMVLGLPILLIPVLLVGLYIRWYKGGDFTPLLRRLERINGANLCIALGLTLASTAIVYQHTPYEMRLGFPSPFIFYYNVPTSGATDGILSNLFSKVLIHLLDGLVDVVIYYLLLRALYWLYQKSVAWLQKWIEGAYP
ncbi:MAG: hypothetical protein U0350_27680 [Caldilineaceae bacterium]